MIINQKHNRPYSSYIESYKKLNNNSFWDTIEYNKVLWRSYFFNYLLCNFILLQYIELMNVKGTLSGKKLYYLNLFVL